MLQTENKYVVIKNGQMTVEQKFNKGMPEQADEMRKQLPLPHCAEY
jgi:hypothetical protein